MSSGSLYRPIPIHGRRQLPSIATCEPQLCVSLGIGNTHTSSFITHDHSLRIQRPLLAETRCKSAPPTFITTPPVAMTYGATYRPISATVEASEPPRCRWKSCIAAGGGALVLVLAISGVILGINATHTSEQLVHMRLASEALANYTATLRKY